MAARSARWHGGRAPAVLVVRCALPRCWTAHTPHTLTMVRLACLASPLVQEGVDGFCFMNAENLVLGETRRGVLNSVAPFAAATVQATKGTLLSAHLNSPPKCRSHVNCRPGGHGAGCAPPGRRHLPRPSAAPPQAGGPGLQRLPAAAVSWLLGGLLGGRMGGWIAANCARCSRVALAADDSLLPR